MQRMTISQLPPIPVDTARAAEESFGDNHPYIKIGDSLEKILSEVSIMALNVVDAELRDPFWFYAFASILQYWEELTDRQMANATRTRVDIKYALRLPLFFHGINPVMLCKFRQELQGNQVSKNVFLQLVDRLHLFVKSQYGFSTDVEQIIAAICTSCRRELVIEMMSNAIEALATYYPEWLRTVSLPSWFQSYSSRQNLHKYFRSCRNLEKTFSSVGEDGQSLLDCVENSDNSNLLKLPEIRMLRQEWHSYFEIEGGQFRLRPANCANCANRFRSLFS